MSTGTLQRLEQRLHEAWHIVERNHLVRIIMEAYDRLSADVDALTAENADLKQQLATATGKPSGTSDDKLNALSDKIEAAMGKPNSGGASTAAPVVGSTSTSVTDLSTGQTTTVDHATGSATTTDASGTPVATDHAAVAAATSAAQAAGVTVPGA